MNLSSTSASDGKFRTCSANRERHPRFTPLSGDTSPSPPSIIIPSLSSEPERASPRPAGVYPRKLFPTDGS